MPDPQASLDAAVARGDVPFAVALAGDAAGTWFEGAAGEAAPGLAAAPDTVLRLFSMTKAVGAVAAMILVERGALDLDAPVASVLPGFADLRVLEGWDGDAPRFRAPRRAATLRQLATHTSGLEYEFWNPEMLRWRQVTKNPSTGSGRLRGLNYPLMADPGTRWGYGTGLDWLGRAVEAVDGRRIDRFCAEEMFGPLEMRDTVFELTPALRARLAAVVAREDDGGLATIEAAPPSRPEFYGMGHALYGTGTDYLRFLRMLLGGGALEGARVLSAASVTRAVGQPDRRARDRADGERGTGERRFRALPGHSQGPFPGVHAGGGRRARNAGGRSAGLGRHPQHSLLDRSGTRRRRAVSDPDAAVRGCADDGGLCGIRAGGLRG